MTDEFEDQSLIEGARRALSPTPADAERVLLATRAAIASAALAGAQAAAAAALPAARMTSFGAPRASAIWKLALGGLSIAAVSGAGGYWLGIRAAPQDDRHELARAVVAAPALPSVNAAAPASMPADVAGSALAAPAVGANAPAPINATATTAPTPPRVAGKRSPSLAAEAPGDESLAFSTQEEITAMRRVERALREHEPQRALTLLFELDRSVPNGKLMQERHAAFAMARCAAGLGSPAQLVAEFAAHYRNSAYLARVRQTCTAQNEPVAP